MGYLGEFEQAILFSVLQLGEAAYGVAIREVIEERTGRTVSSGAIYTALGRLEARGMVRSRKEKPDGSPGRPRKYYTLRSEGARALKESYANLQAMADGVLGDLADLAEG